MFQTIEICPYVRDVLRKMHASIVEVKKKSIEKKKVYLTEKINYKVHICCVGIFFFFLRIRLTSLIKQQAKHMNY